MSDREVIVKAASFFVPVAVNLYVIRDEHSPGGDLFRAALQQRDEYQGLWLIAPEWPRARRAAQAEKPCDLGSRGPRRDRRALAVTGPIAPRAVARGGEALRFRGHGARADGSVQLAVSVRFTYDGKPKGDGAYDNIVLTAADWSAFVPPT